MPHLYGIMPSAEEVIWVFDHLNSPNVGALVDSSHWGIMEPYERILKAVNHQCPDIAEAISRHVMEFYRERAMRAIEASDGGLKDGVCLDIH